MVDTLITDLPDADGMTFSDSEMESARHAIRVFNQAIMGKNRTVDCTKDERKLLKEYAKVMRKVDVVMLKGCWDVIEGLVSPWVEKVGTPTDALQTSMSMALHVMGVAQMGQGNLEDSEITLIRSLGSWEGQFGRLSDQSLLPRSMILKNMILQERDEGEIEEMAIDIFSIEWRVFEESEECNLEDKDTMMRKTKMVIGIHIKRSEVDDVMTNLERMWSIWQSVEELEDDLFKEYLKALVDHCEDQGETRISQQVTAKYLQE